MPSPYAKHFIVIPAIDLKGGKVVRLLRGEMDRATIYGDDPAAVARRFEHEGAELIHVVDLDGAIVGEPRNLDAVRAIRDAVGCRIEVSGGLRTIASVRELIEVGADFVSIGSAAFLTPELIVEACKEYPGRVCGSIDARAGRLAIRGWVETSQLTTAEAVGRFRTAGVAAINLTDISRDGTESGVDAANYRNAAIAAGILIVASGGVATLDDIRALAPLFNSGVVGVIVGRALYEGRFTLPEALAAAHVADSC
jgi:phosphoribosylformimino-5-aminoimidazole carboxamide ribotide isomerase